MERPSVDVTPGEAAPRTFVIPPAVLAHRMQRYAVYLMIIAFLLVLANLTSLTVEVVLWFAAGLAATFALLCAVTVVVLNAIAWNFERMREEMRGGRSATDMHPTEPRARERPSSV
jgi:hypothetical protein